MTKLFTGRFLILFVFSLFLFSSLFSTAQHNTVLEPSNELATYNDSVSVLIIPYNPKYYLSDSDRPIAEASKKSVLTIRENFRTSIDHSLKRQFSDKYLAHSVLNDTSEQAQLDLYRIYDSQVLRYEVSPSYKKEKKTIKRQSSKKQKGLGSETETIPTDNSLLDDQFMNVSFSDDELLAELAARYENDYFLFLNQFELRMDYNDCLDLAKKIYNRKLKIHYTIYDKNGMYVTGDYVKVVFPSNTNHVNEIISRNFHQLARQLAEAL